MKIDYITADTHFRHIHINTYEPSRMGKAIFLSFAVYFRNSEGLSVAALKVSLSSKVKYSISLFLAIYFCRVVLADWLGLFIAKLEKT